MYRGRRSGTKAAHGGADKPKPVVKSADLSMDAGNNATILRQVEPEGPPPTGAAKVLATIKGAWQTRQTEDFGGDKEGFVRTTLRELIVYIVFIIVLCVLTFGMVNSSTYYYTKVLSELFLDNTNEAKGTFREASSVVDVWRFMRGPLVDGLYWETWYNGGNVTGDDQGFILHESKLLGVPRVRMLKVTNHSCEVHKDFEYDIKDCYADYSKADEDKKTFGLGIFPANKSRVYSSETAWKYTESKEIDGSDHQAKISKYGGGGFYQDLANNKADSLAIIQELHDNLWIDRGTRAVLFDFTVYNANINLFCQVRITAELPATGGLIPSWSFRTVKLLRYVTMMDYFVMACEIIFTFFIIYYLIEEVIEIKKNGCAYFKSVWNILDVIVVGISLVCIAFNVFCAQKVGQLLEDLLGKPDIFPDFEFLGYWQTQFNDIVAVAVFFAWIKIFKYISFNKTMNQLSGTLARCAKDMVGFTLMFFIVFLAFCQLAYLVFGTQIEDFSNIKNCIFTQLRIILGDFDFGAMEDANRILGPMYFFVYIFFVFFVLMNMFLAIINDTYAEVKSELDEQESDFEISDYFKRGYGKMMDKLGNKREKIVDIQKAVQSADMDGDGDIDFAEWRKELKARGYSDLEIETVFAKYDQDGDKILNSEERRKMIQDLEGQKADIDAEMSLRPRSARSKMSFDDDESDDEGEKSVISGVSMDEFQVLVRRVDRMEHSIGSIVSKIDAVLVKLEAMEKARKGRKESMTKILDSINEGDGSDEAKREQMAKMVKDELDKWDAEGEGEKRPSSSRPKSRKPKDDQ
jgi:polycystin 2